ncbi:hypothetical protein R50073_05260 [Maricurvus nonylphenolicus]|uniref:GspH/FimT family pseudopilin n=1 Tax=Maricurvus nonylphenolicus TaxID=1008307 RepID=UPI0036F20E2F
MRYSKAFTFIELLTSLAIIGILTGFAIPTFTTLLEVNSSISARDNLLAAINYTRLEAISRVTTITLCPKLTSSTCGKVWSEGILVFTDPNQNGRIDEEEEVLREFSPLWGGGTLRWSSFGSNNYLRYTPLGNTLNQNGSFIYCPTSNNLRYAQVIVINRGGRARAALDSNQNGIVERADGKDVTC